MIQTPYDIHDPFVCLDDITQHPVEMNPVIYNPGKDTVEFRVDLLFKVVKEYFNIELTSDQLISLTKYDIHQLNEFATELRKIIYG